MINNISNSYNFKKGITNQKEYIPQLMKVPQIIIQEEVGIYLLSILFKIENEEWGENNIPLAKETVEYFKENPLDKTILQAIRAFYEYNIDEESLYNFALIYRHPERKQKIFEIIKKFKPNVQDIGKTYEEILNILNIFEKVFLSSSLVTKFNFKIAIDKKLRLGQINEIQKRIESMISFFKPDRRTSNIEKLILVPTDPLYRKNSGRSFVISDNEIIIVSNIENHDNQDHEFLHGIINPIMEKLAQKLTNEDKNKITILASNKLKQDYRDHFFSLICEEFIRTYVNIYRYGIQPQTYEDFREKISTITNNQFMNELGKSPSLNSRCKKLNICNISDLRNKSLEYFERFEINKLQELVYWFYQEYTKQDDKNFEQFVLKNFISFIRKY